MLAHLAHLLHLPPLVAYIIALSALLVGAVSLGWILHRIFHRSRPAREGYVGRFND